MKKMILAVILALFPAALAASGNFTVWAGCSWDSLAGMHSAIRDVAAANGAPEYVYQSLSGIVAGLDGAYWYYSWWGIGGRVSYTRLFDATAERKTPLDRAKYSFGGSLAELLFGIPFLFEIQDGKLSLGGGLYAGLGVASAGLSRTGDDPAKEGSINADGSCFVFEIPLRFTHNFSSSFLFDINLSVRSAYVDKLYIRKTADFDGISFDKGAALIYPSGPYVLDFTGITASFGFNWRFSSADWPWYKKKFSLSE